MMSKKKERICLIVGFLGALLGLCGLVSFNQFVVMLLPLGVRMVSMIVTYWLIALVGHLFYYSNMVLYN